MPGWTVLVAYQLAWFASVAGGGRGLVWPALAAAVAVNALALAASPRRGRTLAFCLSAAALGAAADAALTALGLLSFPIPAASLGPLPWWIAALWLSFVSCVPQFAHWLAARPAMAAACGAVGGPLAYLGAHRFGGVDLAAPGGWIAVAVEFAVLTPVFCAIAARAGLATRAAVPASR